jgi:cation:H+ antiporter
MLRGSGLPFEMVFVIAGFILGLVLLIYSSNKAIEHMIQIAFEWGISPFVSGLILVSIGTDLPEIINSIVSSSLGHADISVGDSLGSVLTQMTLIIGLLPFLGKKFNVDRKKIAIIGVCEVLALILAVSIVEKGYITRINALFLVASWPIFLILFRNAITKKFKEDKVPAEIIVKRRFRHILVAALGFIGVSIGAYVVVQSVIQLSAAFQVSEFFISFFVLAIGTSLPELVVDLAAIRKGQFELAIGDAVGSCIVDASVSIGIGQLFFPQIVSGETAMIAGLYAIFGSIVVILTLALRKKLDKKAGALFILIYFLSYGLLSLR